MFVSGRQLSRTEREGQSMGFTIEDMMILSREQYSMRLVAGNNGWANSINWIHLVEDTTIIQNFWGRELAVTTGLGFKTVEKQKVLVQELIRHHGSGLIVNIGKYIPTIDPSLIKLCDDNAGNNRFFVQ